MMTHICISDRGVYVKHQMNVGAYVECPLVVKFCLAQRVNDSEYDGQVDEISSTADFSTLPLHGSLCSSASPDLLSLLSSHIK